MRPPGSMHGEAEQLSTWAWMALTCWSPCRHLQLGTGCSSTHGVVGAVISTGFGVWPMYLVRQPKHSLTLPFQNNGVRAGHHAPGSSQGLLQGLSCGLPRAPCMEQPQAHAAELLGGGMIHKTKTCISLLPLLWMMIIMMMMMMNLAVTLHPV